MDDGRWTMDDRFLTAKARRTQRFAKISIGLTFHVARRPSSIVHRRVSSFFGLLYLATVAEVVEGEDARDEEEVEAHEEEDEVADYGAGSGGFVAEIVTDRAERGHDG